MNSLHHHHEAAPATGGPEDARRLDRRLWWSVLLNIGITLAEIAGSLVSGSLALLADAFHNLSDVAALTLALVTRKLGRRPPSLKYTYGYKRLEVFAALVNAVALLVVIVAIGAEALRRLQHPQPVQATVMLVVALLALAGNGASVLLLRGAGAHDLNVRGAVLHLLQDALASVAVIVAALLSGSRFGRYVDPVASLVVCFAVLRSALSVVYEAFAMLAEGAPKGVDIERMAERVASEFSPARLHHVHVWEIGPGQRALTAHVLVPDMPLARVEQLCSAIRRQLEDDWGITHATLAPEVDGCGEASLLGGVKTPGACWPAAGADSKSD